MFTQKNLKAYYNTAKRAYPYVQQGLKYYNQYKRMKTQSTKKKGTSGYGVTNQHDAKIVYRKKSMPRKRRNRWKRFVRKVEAVADKGLGTKTRVFNNSLNNANGVGSQAWMSAVLYGKFGTDTPSSTGNLDLANIVSSYGTQRPFKVKLKSAVLDVTLTNCGDSAQGPSCPIEVDVFQVYFRGDPKLGNLEDIVNLAQDRTNTLTGSGALTLQKRGVQLFELPTAISIGNIKIVKKTKFFLPYQGTCTYQIRDPRNRVLNNEDITEGQPAPVPSNSFVMPGWTQGIVVFWKPIAGFENTVVKLAMGCSRKYNYRIDTDSFTEDGFN